MFIISPLKKENQNKSTINIIKIDTEININKSLLISPHYISENKLITKHVAQRYDTGVLTNSRNATEKLSFTFFLRLHCSNFNNTI